MIAVASPFVPTQLWARDAVPLSQVTVAEPYEIERLQVSASGESVQVSVKLNREGVVIAHAPKDEVGNHTAAESLTRALEHNLVLFVPQEFQSTLTVQAGSGVVRSVVVPRSESYDSSEPY